MSKRVLSGYRPSGTLHLGHLHGNLENMINLQEKYECFFFVADWHALTTEYEKPFQIPQYIEDMILDWLAFGLDPKKCTLYRQSSCPEIAELALYFGMITPLPWLERCTTYKEQLRELKGRELATYGFLGYPVLMAADILVVRSELVPVGEDQVPHLELTREIARRFNYLYGNYFPEPQALLSGAKRVPGIDGRKMSKSYGNAIYLNESPNIIKEKVRSMITDPQRVYLKDPGHPEVCSVFSLHQIYSHSLIEEIEKGCREALRGCTECKDILAQNISDYLAPFQSKRKELEKEKGLVEEILTKGAQSVKPLMAETLAQVRKLISLEK